MKPIIPPVDRAALLSELNEKTLLRKTNRAGNELYLVGPESVNVIREIGRLREIAFRNDGGGTGRELDIDEFDTNKAYGYKQLVLWDPDAQEIIGGYRFCICDEAVFHRFGQPILNSSHMFEFSKRFLEDYLPYTLELGRSFVQVEYQSSKAGAKSLYALDNLFDGIAAIGILYNRRIKYFFGKATIYRGYPVEAREMIMVFLRKYFGKNSRLIRIRKEVKVENPQRYAKLFKGLDFKEGYKVLKSEITKITSSSPTAAVGRRAYPITENRIRQKRSAGSWAAKVSRMSSTTSRKQQIRVIQKKRSSASLDFCCAYSLIPQRMIKNSVEK